MSWNKLLLVRSEILGQFVNTLTADGKYPRHNAENFLEQTEMILSRKPKFFSGFSTAFVGSTSNSEYFENKDEPHSLSISEIIDSKRRGYLND